MSLNFYDCWSPEVGESISGNIIYFRSSDGATINLIRSADGYKLIPAEAAEAFFFGKPSDGSFVIIVKTDAGYRWEEPSIRQRRARPA